MVGHDIGVAASLFAAAMSPGRLRRLVVGSTRRSLRAGGVGKGSKERRWLHGDLANPYTFWLSDKPDVPA
ncbi:MAG: hypothetical protein M3P18_13390 [Actinomycetota bacterium]|nr:hypothetical protein [Actinomycetota bacterium]